MLSSLYTSPSNDQANIHPCVFPSHDQRVYKKVPRYYESLLESEDPDLLEEVKERRLAFRERHKDEYSPGRLMAKYKVKKAQVDMLKRGLD